MRQVSSHFVNGTAGEHSTPSFGADRQHLMTQRRTLMIAFLSVDQQVALLGNRIQLGESRFQFGGTGIVRLSVDHHHAFLANIGVETAELERQIQRRAVAKPYQAIQYGSAIVERYVE